MFVHETKVRVLYAHTDKAGVVYYAKYFEFFEAGRTEYFRSLGRSYADFEQAGFLLTVVEAACKYLAPAKYDDLLTIRTRLTQVRRTRVDFEYEVAGPTGAALCRYFRGGRLSAPRVTSDQRQGSNRKRQRKRCCSPTCTPTMDCPSVASRHCGFCAHWVLTSL